MIPKSALNLIVWMAAMYITSNVSRTSQGYMSHVYLSLRSSKLVSGQAGISVTCFDQCIVLKQRPPPHVDGRVCGASPISPTVVANPSRLRPTQFDSLSLDSVSVLCMVHNNTSRQCITVCCCLQLAWPPPPRSGLPRPALISCIVFTVHSSNCCNYVCLPACLPILSLYTACTSGLSQCLFSCVSILGDTRSPP